MSKTEPWNIKTGHQRVSDTLSTFIIFCEDEVSEPIYFKYFETSEIKVNLIKSQKSKMDNVLKAIQHCNQNNLTYSDEDQSYLLDESIQVWCVFDRDKNELNIDAEDTNFDTSIKTATSHGINVAWSNDSFELWILLHFEDIDITNVEYKSREKYYKRLTEIFETLPDKNEQLAKVLSYTSFSYKQKLKSTKNFRNIVRKQIIGNTKVAIRRAKIIEKLYKSEPNSQKSPSTGANKDRREKNIDFPLIVFELYKQKTMLTQLNRL